MTEEQKADIADNNYERLSWGTPVNPNNWNATVHGYFQGWSQICETYGADMLVWVYYANTTSFFIPYDTFEFYIYFFVTFLREQNK